MHSDGNPELRSRSPIQDDALEISWRNSDDCEAAPIQEQGCADQVGVGSEMCSPKMVAYDDNRPCVIFRQERSPDDRLNPKHIKIIGRNKFSPTELGLIRIAPSHPDPGIGRETREHV